MIERILPSQVASVEQWVDIKGSLFPAEELLVMRAVPKRIAEFTGGRTCAREALGLLGFLAAPILIGTAREPIWPQGVVGSITHCQGYCAAAVARTTDLPSVGIDAEPNEPLPSDVQKLVLFDEEIASAHSLSAASEICWDKLLFSAKESFFKAWYPLTRRWLDLKDAIVHPEFSSETFAVELRAAHRATSPEGSEFQFIGRFACNNGLILTTVVASC
jgi:4'-phosphopantetheinyl transferase EntD